MAYASITIATGATLDGRALAKVAAVTLDTNKVGLVANNLAGQAVRMEQNAPNPFNPVTKIRFAVAKPGFVNVRIYNVRGELVKTIASGNYGIGSHEAMWDGSTRVGGKASTGVYFAKASMGNGKGGEVTSGVIKMVMAK